VLDGTVVGEDGLRVPVRHGLPHQSLLLPGRRSIRPDRPFDIPL
jgi:hypothetical protein